MAHHQCSAREAIAIAACDVAGLARPLSSEIPEEGRVYLFASPEDFGGKFIADDLAGRLGRHALPHGVNWDASSEHRGLRFVPKGQPLPAELKPFASEQAKQEWAEWMRHESAMRDVVVVAAAAAAKGEVLNFGSEEIPQLAGARGKKPSRRADERN